MLMFNQPRRRPLVLAIATMAALILACGGGDKGDGGEWEISELTLSTGEIYYAEVTGTVTLQDEFGAIYGTTAEVRYYEDDYETLITEISETIGEDLEDEGSKQSFELSSYEVYMLPALDGLDYVCVEFRADDSNYEDWEQIGCLEGTDD